MHVLALRLALSHLCQKPISRIVVVISMSAILLMTSMVFLLFQSFSKSLAEVRHSQYLTAYLDAAVTPTRETEVLSAVKKLSGVDGAQLVSKDVFVENFSKYFPQLSNELSTLEADTIPRYVKVKVTSDSSEVVQKKLEKVKGIELVEVNKNRYAGLIGALATLRKLALALIAGMSLALLCILLNHFKLRSAFQTQVRNTLLLLGAKESYVLLPFAIEGMIEGAAGGLLAAGILVGYGHVFEEHLNGLFTAIGYHPYHFELTGIAALVAVVGMLSGMMGSVWATLRAKA